MEKLLKLLERQYFADGETSFCYDGVMNNKLLDQYQSVHPRVLFIGKEPHFKGTELGPGEVEDYTRYMDDIMSQKVWKRTLCILHAIRMITQGQEADAEWLDYNKDKIVREAVAKDSFAFVNIKKSAGGENVSNNVVTMYADRYRESLRKQIDILAPDIIFCWGDCRNTTGGVLDHIYRGVTFEKITTFKNGKGLWRGDGCPLVVEYWHPQYGSMVKYLQYFVEGFKQYLAENTAPWCAAIAGTNKE